MRYRPVERRSLLGYPFEVLEPVVPRIDSSILNAIFYLYPSRDDALAGTRAGGTGYIEVMESGVPGMPRYAYGVTAKHVVRQTVQSPASPVIRLNTRSDELDVLPLNENDWKQHPDGTTDLAACFLGLLVPEVHKISVIDNPHISPEKIDGEFGLGDECYFFGRFYPHEGKTQNRPAARFGHLAMLNHEPLDPGIPGVPPQETFLVEAHSVSGNSGSPVFIFKSDKLIWSLGSNVTERQETPREQFEGHKAYLLGVDWCHLSSSGQLLDPKGAPLSTQVAVEYTAGMIGVIPAWKVTELLNREGFVAHRKEVDEKALREHLGSGVTLDSLAAPEGDDDEFGRFEDFTRRLVHVPKDEIDEARKREGK